MTAKHPASAVSTRNDAAELSADDSSASLTLDRVVADLQLLLAVRRHARSQASAHSRNWSDGR